MIHIIKFIRESNAIEGIYRDPTRDEVAAARAFLDLDKITVGDMRNIVHTFAPSNILRTVPGMNVRVGNYIAPDGGPKIVPELATILDFANRHRTPEWAYDVHHRYEDLHPFTDGNGRSGRMLWLWMMKGEAPLGFLHHWYYQSLEAGKGE